MPARRRSEGDVVADDFSLRMPYAQEAVCIATDPGAERAIAALRTIKAAARGRRKSARSRPPALVAVADMADSERDAAVQALIRELAAVYAACGLLPEWARGDRLTRASLSRSQYLRGEKSTVRTILILVFIALVLFGLVQLMNHLHAAWLVRSRMRVLVMAELYLNMASLSYAHAGEADTMNQLSLMRAYLRRLAIEESERKGIPLPDDFAR